MFFKQRKAVVKEEKLNEQFASMKLRRKCASTVASNRNCKDLLDGKQPDVDCLVYYVRFFLIYVLWMTAKCRYLIAHDSRVHFVCDAKFKFNKLLAEPFSIYI